MLLPCRLESFAFLLYYPDCRQQVKSNNQGNKVFARMDRQKSLMSAATTASPRPFSSIEGWRELKTGVYSIAGSGLQVFNLPRQFDPERYDHDESTSQTRMSKRFTQYSSQYSSAGSRSRKSALEEVEEQGRLSRDGSETTETAWTETHDSFPYDHHRTPSSGSNDDPNPFAESRDPFGDENAVSDPEKAQEPILPPPEEPYHIFSQSQKWSLVMIIGAAGLFSGLSSNIYFPSLDAIAKVCHPKHSYISSLQAKSIQGLESQP